MSKIYYKEEQKFNQLWIWMLLFFLAGIWIWQLVQQVFLGIPFGNNPAPDFVVYIIGLFPLAAIWLFRTLTLETFIDNEGVHFRFKPFQKKFRTFKPENIQYYEVRKYRPIRDYGGWGIRFGTSAKGDAYNVRGNDGVYFELKNKKRFMLGTQNPGPIRSAMEKLMKQS
jgi:hypothetical protein